MDSSTGYSLLPSGLTPVWCALFRYAALLVFPVLGLAAQPLGPGPDTARDNSEEIAAAISGPRSCPNSRVNGWAQREPNWAKFPPQMSACDALHAGHRTDGFPEYSSGWCARSQKVMDCRSAAVSYAQRQKELERENAASEARKAERAHAQPGKPDASDADRLARELGVESRAQTPGSKPGHDQEADQLARQLGISPERSNPKDYTADQLSKDLARWDEQQRQLKDEEDRQRQAREEYERVAAIERAKREEIMRDQQMTVRQQHEEEEERQRQASALASEPDEPSGGTECSGFLGTLGCISKGAATIVIANDMAKRGMVPPIGVPGLGSASQPASSVGGPRADSGNAACVDADRQNQSCDAIPAGNSICGYYRAMASCLSRVVTGASQCPAVAANARTRLSQAEDGVRQACEH